MASGARWLATSSSAWDRPKTATRRDAGDGGEGVAGGPEVVIERVQEIDQRLGGKRAGEGESAVLRPDLDEGGQRADPPVRMIGGTLAVGFPRDGAIGE